MTTSGRLLHGLKIFEVTVQAGGPTSVNPSARRVPTVLRQDRHNDASVHIPGAVVLGLDIVVRGAFIAARRNGSPDAAGRGVPRALRSQWETVRRSRRRGTFSGSIAARQRGCRWLELGCNSWGDMRKNRNDRSHCALTRQPRCSDGQYKKEEAAKARACDEAAVIRSDAAMAPIFV